MKRIWYISHSLDGQSKGHEDGKLRGSKCKHNQIKLNITHEHGAKSNFFIQNMSISQTLHMPFRGEGSPIDIRT